MNNLTQIQTEELLLLQHPSIWWICPVCDWTVSGANMGCSLTDAECQGCGCRNLSDYEPIAKPIYGIWENENE